MASSSSGLVELGGEMGKSPFPCIYIHAKSLELGHDNVSLMEQWRQYKDSNIGSFGVNSTKHSYQAFSMTK